MVRLGVIPLTVDPDHVGGLHVVVILGVVILFIIELGIRVLVILSLCILARSDVGLCA